MAQPGYSYRTTVSPTWGSSPRSLAYDDPYQGTGYQSAPSTHRPTSVTYATGAPVSYSQATPGRVSRVDPSYPPHGTYGIPNMSSASPVTAGTYGSYSSATWDTPQGGYSPSDSMADIKDSPNVSDYSLEHPEMSPSGKDSKHSGSSGKNRPPQRRPSNRDEFDGPHQFLQRPTQDYVSMQEQELPHLPTNLLVQEQDSILAQVNDRLSRCAFDFVAKYQFPIPLTQDMRPVERPEDREWTEWVYLLKRLATKRRIPARVLYNGQIKQLVTILENSLEMRHAAKHQSRPLKDDRNILQLISAGIQVAKILKDAQAMAFLDKLYLQTEDQIRERSMPGRFRR